MQAVGDRKRPLHAGLAQFKLRQPRLELAKAESYFVAERKSVTFTRCDDDACSSSPGAVMMPASK
eukprot:6198058-Pleurochrysis_carterae.AAC.3